MTPSAPLPSPSTATVISNLAYVAIDQIRTHTHAIVIRRSSMGERYQIVGFGTSHVVSTFDIEIPSYLFELTEAAHHGIVVATADGQTRPLVRGAILNIQGWDREVHLIADPNSTTPIDVTSIDLGIGLGLGIDYLWRTVDAKIAEHWNDPYFPVMVNRPTAFVRDESRRELSFFRSNDDTPTAPELHRRDPKLRRRGPNPSQSKG
jgi:hypothetical protein